MKPLTGLLIIVCSAAMVGCGEQRVETGYDSGPGVAYARNLVSEPGKPVEPITGTPANAFTAVSAEGMEFKLKFVDRKVDGSPARWNTERTLVETKDVASTDAFRFDAVLTISSGERLWTGEGPTLWPLDENGARITLNGSKPGFSFGPMPTPRDPSEGYRGNTPELLWTLPVAVAHIRADGTASFEIDMKGKSTDVIEEVDISGDLKASTHFRNLHTKTIRTGELRDFVISYEEDRLTRTSDNLVVAVVRDANGKLVRYKPYKTVGEGRRTTSYFRSLDGEFVRVALERAKAMTIRFDGVPMSPKGISVAPTKVSITRTLTEGQDLKPGTVASIKTGFSGVTAKGTKYKVSGFERAEKAWTPDGIPDSGDYVYLGTDEDPVTQFQIHYSNGDENVIVHKCIALDPKTGKALDIDFGIGAFMSYTDTGEGQGTLTVQTNRTEPVDLLLYFSADVLRVNGVHLRPLTVNKSLTSR